MNKKFEAINLKYIGTFLFHVQPHFSLPFMEGLCAGQSQVKLAQVKETEKTWKKNLTVGLKG